MKDSIQKERSTPVMHPTAAFLTDVGLVAVLSLALVAYVKPHLNALLMELCGTAERARFWLAFSNVTLVLVPLIFALDYNPDSASGTNLVFDMATQLKHRSEEHTSELQSPDHL